MIRLRRPDLPSELAHQLAQRTENLRGDGRNADHARKRWSGASAVRASLKQQLASMATGINRCMYCADSFATDIDHFEPISRTPLRTFDWHNHFLACSHCNSNHKRDRFPVDETGSALLVNPACEDPYEHLALVLSIGEYSPLTEKGRQTVEVFGLNRTDLTRGRAAAFTCMGAILRDRQRQVDLGDHNRATELTEALRCQPFADVLSAMLRYRHLPGAAAVLDGPDVVAALADPALDFWGTASTLDGGEAWS